MLWVYGYPRFEASDSQKRVMGMGWQFASYPRYVNGLGMIPSPPVILGDMCVVCPTDSDRIFSFDLKKRSALWAVDRRDSLLAVGVSHEKLILQGGSLRAIELETGRQAWETVRLANIIGSSAATETHVYTPVEDGVLRINVENGETEGKITYGSDFRRAGGVNVFSLPGRLVLLSARKIRFLFDEAVILAEVERLLDENPESWRPYWLRGELWSVKKHYEKAQVELLKALKLARSAGSAVGRERLEKRLFRFYMDWAEVSDKKSCLDEAAKFVGNDKSRELQVSLARIDLAIAVADKASFEKGLSRAIGSLQKGPKVIQGLQAELFSHLNKRLAEVRSSRPALLMAQVRKAEVACEEAARSGDFSKLDGLREFLGIPEIEGRIALVRAQRVLRDKPTEAMRELWLALGASPGVVRAPGFLETLMDVCEKHGERYLAHSVAQTVLSSPSIDQDKLAPGMLDRLRRAGSQYGGEREGGTLTAPGDLVKAWSFPGMTVRTGPGLIAGPERVVVVLRQTSKDYFITLLSPATGKALWDDRLRIDVGPGSTSAFVNRVRQYAMFMPATLYKAGSTWVLAMPFGMYGFEPNFKDKKLVGLVLRWERMFDVNYHRYPASVQRAMQRYRANLRRRSPLVSGYDFWDGNMGWLVRLIPGRYLLVIDAWTGRTLHKFREPANKALVGAPVLAGRWLAMSCLGGTVEFLNITTGRHVVFKNEGVEFTGSMVLDGNDRLWVPTDEGMLLFNMNPLRLEKKAVFGSVSGSLARIEKGKALLRLSNGNVALVDTGSLKTLMTLNYDNRKGDVALDVLDDDGAIVAIEARGSPQARNWIARGGHLNWKEIHLRRVSKKGKTIWSTKLLGQGYGYIYGFKKTGRSVFLHYGYYDRAKRKHVNRTVGFDIRSGKQLFQTEKSARRMNYYGGIAGPVVQWAGDMLLVADTAGVSAYGKQSKQ